MTRPPPSIGTSAPGLRPARTAAVIRALGTADFFPALRALIREEVPIDNLVALAFRRDHGPLILHQWSPQDPNYFQLLYAKGAYQLDPFFLASLDPRMMGAHRLRDIAPDDFADSDYFSTYYRKVEIVDEIGLLFPFGERVTLHLSLGRREGSALYTRAELDVIRHLEPALSAFVVAQCGPAVERWLERPEAPSGTRGWLGDFAVTAREAELADMILRGHSNGSMAAVLGISAETVKVHRKNLYAKLRISSQSELYMLFIEKMMPTT